jgi:hypothetical protein
LILYLRKNNSLIGIINGPYCRALHACSRMVSHARIGHVDQKLQGLKV